MGIHNFLFLPGIVNRMDLVFAIDTSSDVDKTEFDQMKNFIDASLQSYQISKSRDHVGIISYGNNARTSLPLSSGTDKGNIRRAIPAITRVDGKRRISTAIEHARVAAFGQSTRKDVSKILALFVAGKNDVIDAASLPVYAALLRSEGIQLMIIEVGEHAQKRRLTKILDSADNYIQATSAALLPEVYGNLEQRIAKTSGSCIH